MAYLTHLRDEGVQLPFEPNYVAWWAFVLERVPREYMLASLVIDHQGTERRSLPADLFDSVHEYGLNDVSFHKLKLQAPHFVDLAKSTTFTYLRLEDCEFASKDLAALAGSTMRYFEVKNCSLDDESLKYLKDCKALRDLYLHGTDVRGSGLRYLAETELRELGLQGQRIDDAALLAACGLPKLQTLYLDSVNVTEKGISALSGRDISRLELSNIKITKTMAGAIAKLRSLRYLALWNCRFENGAVEQLTSLPVLESLGLDNCNVTDQDVVSLGALRSLDDLILSHTKITGATLGSLASCPLTRLYLEGTLVGDKEIEILGTFERLRDINVKSTKVTRGGLKALEGRLPDTQIELGVTFEPAEN